MRLLQIGLLVIALSAGGDKASKPAALRSLVEAERSFARTCSEKGIRASFLLYFADDGIAFKPEPFRYKEFMKDLPPQPDPMAVSLKWEPQFAGVASSGDLGFTTGPSIRIDGRDKDRTKHYGQFFSIWKKQKDGRWKVAVDIGTPVPTLASPLGLPCKESSVASTSPKEQGATHDYHKEMVNLEHRFSEACLAGGVLRAYLSRVSEEVRLHRENQMPIVGTEAVRSFLSGVSIIPFWTPLASDVSVAGDLGYTYGSYEFKPQSDGVATVEKGYYLHVWKRNEEGAWKLVADITNPQTPADKK